MISFPEMYCIVGIRVKAHDRSSFHFQKILHLIETKKTIHLSFVVDYFFFFPSQDSPFVKVNENGDLDGMFGRILRELCTTLNFSLNVVSEVEEYGIWNPKKNTWSGAIGELYNGRADISISDFSITSARFNAVDFTFPLLLSKSYLYIQKPQIFTFKWTTYFLVRTN